MRMRHDDDRLRALMLAGLAGDGVAHAALLRALLPPLRTFFRRRLSAREDVVEDLLQETLIAVHQRRATYDPSRPFGAWLFAIARYKLVDNYRHAGRTSSRHTPLDDLDELPDEFAFAEASDARADLDRLFEDIPEQQAAVLRATRIEGLSTAEAAERLGIGESDVKVSAHRGLKALADRVRGTLK